MEEADLTQEDEKTQMCSWDICNVPTKGFIGVEQKRNTIGHVNATSKHQEAPGSFMLCTIPLVHINTSADNVLSVV